MPYTAFDGQHHEDRIYLQMVVFLKGEAQQEGL